ncbi:MAG: hypothetical protein MZW92_59280 [Comamonadaceae bacterium]|nr:hypothetical protein [Comamonadaceae bacterium]
MREIVTRLLKRFERAGWVRAGARTHRACSTAPRCAPGRRRWPAATAGARCASRAL